MAVLAPQVTAAGVVVPSYADVLAQLQNAYMSIYGTDVVLTPDTQDGQFLGILAQIIVDCGNALLAAYNNQSPQTAQGIGLSNIVKINGLKRLTASNSQADIRIVGQVGATINNGVVGDNQNLGTRWALPEEVVIPDAGEITVTATCQTAGAIAAAAGTLTEIITPTLGWQTAANAGAATPGDAVETDAELRERQTFSTANAAETTFDSIKGSIANLPGVGRIALYENNGDVPDGNGLVSHSIAVVVQGGDAQSIAGVIAAKKAPGISTNGTTEEIVIDPAGVPSIIKFYPLVNDTIEVVVNIKSLPGYVVATGEIIKQAVAAFINTLDIGEKSYLSRLYAPAGLQGAIAQQVSGYTQAQLDVFAKTFEVTSITQNGLAADVAVPFNHAAVCVYPDDIVLVVSI